MYNWTCLLHHLKNIGLKIFFVWLSINMQKINDIHQWHQWRYNWTHNHVFWLIEGISCHNARLRFFPNRAFLLEDREHRFLLQKLWPKIKDETFQNSWKTPFLGHEKPQFWDSFNQVHFCPKNIFRKNLAVMHNLTWTPNVMPCQRKLNKKKKVGRTNGP